MAGNTVDFNQCRSGHRLAAWLCSASQEQLTCVPLSNLTKCGPYQVITYLIAINEDAPFLLHMQELVSTSRRRTYIRGSSCSSPTLCFNLLTLHLHQPHPLQPNPQTRPSAKPIPSPPRSLSSSHPISITSPFLLACYSLKIRLPRRHRNLHPTQGKALQQGTLP